MSSGTILGPTRSYLEEVLEWLRDHGLIYTALDEPQFPGGKTLPPLAQWAEKIDLISSFTSEVYAMFNTAGASTGYLRPHCGRHPA